MKASAILAFTNVLLRIVTYPYFLFFLLKA